ncbi:hypothetical protein Agub_g9447 [Astrephomene gubernaculifera]|uniref:Uncharacterized protein n=1 Tax=Astrephomene gubernaculifera TaxID=47775 RepID=A0AAD3DW04_9CHLO|nr:hypothetical protein Agub_g9447 [Astrephomene gubernaculifera]
MHGQPGGRNVSAEQVGTNPSSSPAFNKPSTRPPPTPLPPPPPLPPSLLVLLCGPTLAHRRLPPPVAAFAVSFISASFLRATSAFAYCRMQSERYPDIRCYT